MATNNDSSSSSRSPLKIAFLLLIFTTLFTQIALRIIKYTDSLHGANELTVEGKELSKPSATTVEPAKAASPPAPVVVAVPPVPPKPPKAMLPGHLPERPFQIPGNVMYHLKHAEAGILIDTTYNQILWSKNKDKAVPIASMTKIMTGLLLAEAVEDNKVDLKTLHQMTKDASRIGGVSVWLDPREKASLESLGKAMMIRSANDAAYMVSKILSNGKPELFIRDMNLRARKLGLKRARFYNPNGLPGKGNRQNLATVEEIGRLAFYVQQYPLIAEWVSTKQDKFSTALRRNDPRCKEVLLQNTNKLLYQCKGVNGMKTGFTNAAGWCLAATCERNNRKMIAVVAGMPDKNTRNWAVKGLLEWAYSQEP